MKHHHLLLSALFALAQPVCASWRWDDPQPQGNALFAAAVSGGANPTVVAVGELGTVIRRAGSSDVWSSVGPVAGGASLSGVVWSGSRFLASGISAGLWESTDGLSWTQNNAAVQAFRLLRAGSNIVALGGSTTWVSSGGEFTEQPLSAAGISSYRGAASDGSRLLLFGSSGLLATSTDGLSWNKTTQSPALVFLAADGGPEGFLVGGFDQVSDKGFLRASSDGNTWTDVALPADGVVPFRLFSIPIGWLLIDYNTGSLYQREDTEGAEWARVGGDLEGFYPAACLAAPEDRAFLFGDRGTIASLGGGTITPELPAAMDSLYLYNPRFSAACTGGVIAAIDGNVINSRLVRYYRGEISPDGVDWSAPSPAPVRGFTALASVGDSALVGFSSGATGDAGTGLAATSRGFYRSPDGVEWEPLGRVEDDSGSDLVSGNVVSLACRPDNSAAVVLTRDDLSLPGGYSAVRGIYRTSDWNEWQQISLPAFRSDPPVSEESVESLLWDGEKFVLMLYPGRIFTSSDGLSWQQLPALPEGIAAVSVASSGGGCIVVRTAVLQADGSYGVEDSGGEKFFVFDGGRWWPRDTGRRPPLMQRCIIRAGNAFAASGEGAEILTSSDGFGWAAHDAPGAPYALLWNGNRLLAFNDSFAAFSCSGFPEGGTPLAMTSLSPRTCEVAAGGETYEVSLDIAEGEDWSVANIPSWAAVSPSSGKGPAQIVVQVSANTGKTPRGAVMTIAGQEHMINQPIPAPAAPFNAAGGGGTLKIPFSGDWSLAFTPGTVAPRKGLASGKGSFTVVVSRNESVDARTIFVNVNGTDYRIEQEGLPLPVLLAGRYSGLVGYLQPEVSPGELENYTAAFEGYATVALAPGGTYSAQLALHDGAKIAVFRGKGALSADGTLAEAFWSGRGKEPPIKVRNLAVVRDDDGRQYLHGEFEREGTRFGIIAGRIVFSAKTSPLPSDYAGPATFFLTTYGESGISADSGVGSALVGIDGVVRLRGVLADGAKFSASSAIWGALEPELIMPFFFSGGRGRLVCGFTRYDAAAPFTDWDGEAALISPGIDFEGQPLIDPTYLSASLCAYRAPAKGASGFRWNKPALMYMAWPEGEEIGEIEAELSSPAPNTIALESIIAGNDGANIAFSYSPKDGLLKGKVVAAPGRKALRFMGAINQKQSNINGDFGSFLGLIPGAQSGRFEITPP